MSGMVGLLRLAVSAVVTGLVVAACAPRPEPEVETEIDDTGDVSPEPQQTPSTQAEIREGVMLRLAADPDALVAGGAIDFSLTVTNNSDDELVLDFPDGQRFDFEVSEGGTPLWRWATDMFFPQMLGRERVPAGDSLVWSVTLGTGVPAGHYTARGTMTTNSPVTVELEFDVGEGESPS